MRWSRFDQDFTKSAYQKIRISARFGRAISWGCPCACEAEARSPRRVSEILCLLRAKLVFSFLASTLLTACFGPYSMKKDIAAYNQDIVQSETDMLLYNVGLMANDQPTHFMMLSSISQSRQFSANAGFQWSQVFDAINPITATTRMFGAMGILTGRSSATTSGSNSTSTAWQAGPFSTGIIENPTITYVPIQGPDFAQRFESPLRDKFTYMLEDRWWYGTPSDYRTLVELFTQSLYLYHADTSDPNNPKRCKAGGSKPDGSALYENRLRDSYESEDKSNLNVPDYFYPDFSGCVEEIVSNPNLNVALIDGHNPVPTKVAGDPSATDAVNALQQIYEWREEGKGYKLSTPVRIPAWLDYDPVIAAARTHGPSEAAIGSLSAPWWHSARPGWENLQYRLPKGYQWKTNSEANGAVDFAYVLVPDGYTVKQLDVPGPAKFVLVPEGFVPVNLRSVPSNKCSENAEYTPVRFPKGSYSFKSTNCGARLGETYILLSDAEAKALRDPNARYEMIHSNENVLSYSDGIVHNVEPVPQDYFYFELRQNKNDDDHWKNRSNDYKDDHPKVVDDSTAKLACIDDKNPKSQVVCGYLKIGNLFEIMQRLAKSACRADASSDQRDQCVFGISDVLHVPSWADRSVSIGSLQYVWEPYHSPEDQFHYQRDRKAITMLYKLYQMSLVDTSKLVTGTPIVTIPTK